MKHLGVFNSASIPVSEGEYGTLYLYASDMREVKIYFKKTEPRYQVKYVAVLCGCDTYDVYKYEYYEPNPDKLKSFIGNLIERALLSK